MTKNLFATLILITCASGTAIAGDIDFNNTAPKAQVLFVCGGNTGRSIMASWYTNARYGNNIEAFSRGSGIDPLDDITPESNAAQLILNKHYASESQLKSQRATATTIQDIYSANIVLTMTSSHRDRLVKLIDRECLSSNIDLRGLSDSSKAQWVEMCKNKAQLKAKIHTLIGCTTGVDADVEDAYGKDMQFYQQTLTIIQNNIDAIAKNYKQTGNWCREE